MSVIPPVDANDKRLINCETDVLQLEPFKYQWAWDWYLNLNKNHWMPNDVAMGEDKLIWRDSDPNKLLTDGEKHMVRTDLAMLTAMDMCTKHNIELALQKHFVVPEISMVLTRHAMDEAIHVHSYKYAADELGEDPKELFNTYRNVPEIWDKIQFANDVTEKCIVNVDTSTLDGRRDLLIGLIFWYICYEYGWFATGLLRVSSLNRQAKMVRTCEIFQYILRDEHNHARYGCDLINSYMIENPDCVDDRFISEVRDIVLKSIDLEIKAAKYTIPEDSLCISFNPFVEMLKFNVSNMLRRVDISIYDIANAKPALPWMFEILESNKEKNFFETRVTDYQRVGLSWDDDDGYDDWHIG